MMKRSVFAVLLLIVVPVTARASHITGGEMFYRFTGINNGQYQYEVTLKLFQRCNSGRVFPNPTIISIFDRTNNTRITDLNVPLGDIQTISITEPDPCITNPPDVCYEVAYYRFTLTLPATSGGYLLASQVNFRINGINNLEPGSGNVGATYTAEIPGTGSIPAAMENNSARFTGSDLVVVCADNPFTYSFAAEDQDGDQLRYSFCSAFASSGGGGGSPQPTGQPPLPEVPYGTGFDGSSPLGLSVQVDANTGLIAGIAPGLGIYVVTVCVEEIRNGVVIAIQRKDIQIHIADCDVAAAKLAPEYLLCKNTQTIQIANQSSSPLIATTDWEFSNASGTILYTSNATVATYTFPAIGIYTVKLVINRNQSCSDSTTAIIRVFPGFNPDFSFSGICVNKPTLFTDLSSSVYGVPDSWSWDFGQPGTNNDISTQQNPQYTYPDTGIKQARLIVTDTRGCRDTVYRDIPVINKPLIQLAFRDTLICRNDQLLLQASGSGIFSWTPLVQISDPGTATPTVSPLSTTTYYVELNDNGCRNTDSVRVNVVNFVTLQAMPDTTICRGDTIQLRVISDGLQYTWTPAGQCIDPAVKNPFVITGNNTQYGVTAVIGGCSASANILVSTVPYPVVQAGPDFTMCYNTSSQLQGTTDGSSWSWEPAAYVNHPGVLDPVIYPPRTTAFVLTAYDTRGCPKPGRDTVLVSVLPKMLVSAGADTAVVINQPLQLQASGGIAYAWSPAFHLSNPHIPDPVALFDLEANDTRFKVVAFSPEGCKDSAFVHVKVYKTAPTVFVPSAFTPNHDGKNDLLRPIAAGILRIEHFTVYNRWGQMVFSTGINGHGWDGRINGQLQHSGVFVWMVKAVDYNGLSYFQKGTVAIIR